MEAKTLIWQQTTDSFLLPSFQLQALGFFLNGFPIRNVSIIFSQSELMRRN